MRTITSCGSTQNDHLRVHGLINTHFLHAPSEVQPDAFSKALMLFCRVSAMQKCQAHTQPRADVAVKARKPVVNIFIPPAAPLVCVS
jgi:hypothetical protein